jgi:hypothetical protein
MTTDTPRTHLFGTPNDSVAPEELLKRNTTTDTPRTDSATELYGERPFLVSAVPVEFAEGIERELAASKAEVERLRAALELIATPRRPDGTYNRCREACETLAKEALNPTDK